MKLLNLSHFRPQFFSKITKFLKTFILGVIIGATLAGGVILNIRHEQKIQAEQLHQQQVAAEKLVQLKNEAALDTTANIIKRDGKLSLATAKKYATWIYEAGLKYNVDPLLILSVMSVESGFKHNAVSPTGPIGLLQIAASWHREKTTKAALYNPRHNIYVGTQILREYVDRSSSEKEALLRYNGSLGKSSVYAVKVLSKKTRYESEIQNAVRDI